MKRADRLRQLGIGEQLKHMRHNSGLSTRRVAACLGISPASVNRNERGQRVPARDELTALCALYGVTGEQKRALIEHAIEAAQTPGWLESARITSQPATLTVLEQRCVAITKVAVALVPGLVQTADYTRLVLGARLGRDAEEVERVTRNRVLRQTMLSKQNAPEATFLLEEGVLRRTLGDPQVLRDQLDHLLILQRRPNVHMRVLPFDAAVHPTPSGYSLYRLPDGTTCTFHEADRIGMFLADGPELTPFIKEAEEIERHCLSEEESCDLIREASRAASLTC